MAKAQVLDLGRPKLFSFQYEYIPPTQYKLTCILLQILSDDGTEAQASELGQDDLSEEGGADPDAAGELAGGTERDSGGGDPDQEITADDPALGLQQFMSICFTEFLMILNNVSHSVMTVHYSKYC